MQTEALDSASAPATQPAATRWFGVGRSSGTDSARAGAQAAEQAMRGAEGKLIVVFASETHDLTALLGGIRTRTSEIPLIGCSTAGEIASDGPGDEGVVVVASRRC